MSLLLIARLARASRFLLPLALVFGSFALVVSPLREGNATAVRELSPAIAAGVIPTFGSPAVEGWVTDHATGRPLGGAAVRIAGAVAFASDDGYFRFAASELTLASVRSGNHFVNVRAQVDMPDYARWSIEDARYYPGDTLRLYPKLMPAGAITPLKHGPMFTYLRGESNNSPLDVTAPDSSRLALSMSSATAAPPATIRVYRTATGVVDVVPFREYVKHVLPSEWVPSWGPESLKAGAMAVKSYAWYWASRGGKQVALGADVKDNVDDQVYDPNISYASTDAAVDATFNYAITRNGELFQAQYCAGSYSADPSGDCPWPSQYMTQWGSAFHADQGRTWGWILGFYYSGSIITPNPPGGTYTGPLPTPSPVVAQPVPAAPPAVQLPPSSGFSVGQGSARADVFQAAYSLNGGAATLGAPIGPVRWWMQYVTEHNVVAQPFASVDGRGNTWLVFDVLKANDATGYRAFLVNGGIATAYVNHTPPGPEWIGAPTSDPYIVDAARPQFRAQDFVNGKLVESIVGVQLVSKAEPVQVTAPPATVPNTSGTSAARVRVQWLGRAGAPADTWVQPITLHLSKPGDPTIFASFQSSTDRQGVALFRDLPSGIYNVHVKGAHSLQTARAAVTLANGTTVDIDMKAQVEGDVDGDNCVTVADFSFVQSLFGTHKGTPGFNAAADLNGDGAVTMSDVSLLRSGFDMCGDISADNDIQPLSLSAPGFAQHLSPWLNPEKLQRGLSMNLVASNSQPRKGDIIEVRVQAVSNSQSIDGASLLLRYDPSQLSAVDSLGATGSGVEPGLALPSVMGNWIDHKGGLIGYAASMVQGTPPSGEITVATARFKFIGDSPSTTVGFERTPIGAVQLTNGGTDLLGQAVGITLTRQP